MISKKLIKKGVISLCALLCAASMPFGMMQAEAANKDLTNSLKKNSQIRFITKNVNLFVETSSAVKGATGTNRIKLNDAGKVDLVCAAIMGDGKADGVNRKDVLQNGAYSRIRDKKIISLHKRLFGSSPDLSSVKMTKQNQTIKKNGGFYYHSGDWGDGAPTYSIKKITGSTNNCKVSFTNDYKDYQTGSKYYSQGMTTMTLKKDSGGKYILGSVVYKMGNATSAVSKDMGAYASVINSLKKDQAYAFVDMSETVDALLVTDYTYQYNRSTRAAIGATVYGLDSNGAPVSLGEVQSAGTAYPLSVGEGHALFYGNGHGVMKATLGAGNSSLEIIETANEVFDSNGNATYFYNGQAVPKDDDLKRLFTEWFDQGRIINFTVVK